MNNPQPSTAPTANEDGWLAIIVPAFKGRHLALALASIAAQTDRRFRLYVADDGSPEPLEEIVRPFRGRCDLVYRRFAENLGGRSLVAHWARAMALGDEPWVWIFSDDDEMAPECVAEFHAARARARPGAELFRFQLDVISHDKRPLPTTPQPGEWESGAEFVTRLIRPNPALCVVQNFVFARRALARIGGFPDYPGGMFSDLVAWPEIALQSGIEAVPGARVRFRQHAGSITGRVLAGGRLHHLWLAMEAAVPRLRDVRRRAGVTEMTAAEDEFSMLIGYVRFREHGIAAGDYFLGLRITWRLWPEHRRQFCARFAVDALRPTLRRFGPYRWLASRRARRDEERGEQPRP